MPAGHNDDTSSQTNVMRISFNVLILKLSSLINKYSQQFFDAYYTVINLKIKYYFLMTLHNLSINVMKKIFQLSSSRFLNVPYL